MAKWRAIHKDISTSGQVIRLSVFGQLLFERMITHADDWGIITGDPLELKAKTMPTVDNPLEDFDEALAQMDDLGLVRRYQPDGFGPLIWILTFDKHQPAAVIGRRSDPSHSLHPDDRRFVEDVDICDEDATAFNEKAHKITKSDENVRLEQSRADKTKAEQKREEQTTSDKRAPPDDADDAASLTFATNLQILTEMGVAEPTASECATYPHVTPGYLESLVKEMANAAARGRKLGQGWLVTQIRNKAPPAWRR